MLETLSVRGNIMTTLEPQQGEKERGGGKRERRDLRRCVGGAQERVHAFQLRLDKSRPTFLTLAT